MCGIIFFANESGIIPKASAQSCNINDVFNVTYDLGVAGTISANLGCSLTTTVSYGCHGNGTEECPSGYYIKEVGFGTCLLDNGNITRLICCRP